MSASEVSTASRRKGIGGWLARPRFWIGLLILLFWAATMWRVWMNESGRSGSGLREMGITQEMVLSTWRDYDQWMEVRRQGERIGISHLEISQKEPVEPETAEQARRGLRPLPDFLMEYRLRMNLPGIGQPLDMQAKVRMNPAFEMKTLVAAAQVAGLRWNLEAFVEGDHLYYRLRRAGEGNAPGLAGLLGPADLSGRSPLRGPVILSDVVLPVISRAEVLEVGEEWTARVSNPLRGKLEQTVHIRVEAKETLEVAGEPREAWRLTERMGNLSSTAWYDGAGQPLKREIPGGLEMRLISREAALEHDQGFRTDLPTPEEPEREWIRTHLNPELTDRALEDFLPPLPGI